MALIARTKTWIAEKLAFADLNAEFDGIIDVLDGTASPQKNVKVAYDNADLPNLELSSSAAAQTALKLTVSGAGAKGLVVNDGASDVAEIDKTGNVKGSTLQSDVGTGTKPVNVASTTLCDNLNADLLDGVEGSGYLTGSGDQTITKNSANLTWEWASDTGIILKIHETSTTYEYTIEMTGDDLQLKGDANVLMVLDSANAQVEFPKNVEVQGNNSATIQTVTDQANVDMDCDSGSVGILSLGGNRTLADLSNAKVGGTYILIVKQTGSYTLAFNSKFKFAGGTAPTITTGAGSVDILTFVCEDATTIYCTSVQDMS